MSDLPKTMKAIKVVEPGKPEIQEVPLPKMRDDCILVKVKAVALNPYASSNPRPQDQCLSHANLPPSQDRLVCPPTPQKSTKASPI